jgi:hypothetical protein
MRDSENDNFEKYKKLYYDKLFDELLFFLEDARNRSFLILFKEDIKKLLKLLDER